MNHRSRRHTRRVALGSAIGTFVEYYDFTAYGFLAITLAAVFFPTQDPTVGLLSALAVFGAAFVLRPLGGIVLGHLGDRYGRQPVLAWAVITMALSSFLVGVLPGYASAGVWATLLLVLLRGVQGLSAGGEIGGAATYVAEWSPHRRRGFMCANVQVGNLLGVLTGSVLVALLYATLDDGQMESWGWRIPFLLSLPMGLIGLYIRRRLEESPEFEALREDSTTAVKHESSPVATALRRDWASIVRVAGFAVGGFAGYYIVYVYGATFLHRQGGLTSSQAAWCTSGSLVLAAATVLGWGALSDRVGRRPILLGGFAAMAVLAYPAFLLMDTGNVTLAFLGQATLGLCEAAVMGPMMATYTELFRTSTRFSGFGIGYNIGSILTGGTAPYISTWLIDSTGDPRSPGLFLMTAAAISVITALRLPETAHSPLRKD
ncbi:MFS transporter [Nonomuraea deserti]|nr:MFS transporter [Nonomuraea deserti]